MKKFQFKIVLVMIAVLLCVYGAQAQCAMCKEAAKSSMENDPNSIAKGLNKGILLLMAIPYLILGIIFRKEIVQLFKTLRGKTKEPMNKNRLQKLTFALTFASVLIVLFLLFLNVQSQR